MIFKGKYDLGDGTDWGLWYDILYALGLSHAQATKIETITVGNLTCSIRKDELTIGRRPYRRKKELK
jgi:hypothetical protein